MLLAKDIEIDDFIFHVVHHGEDNPILMDSTPLGAFEIFFKERIAEVLSGNRFTFSESSLFIETLQQIHENPGLFVQFSKVLAKSFHQHQDRRIKPGVMILIICRVEEVQKYILIKYDNEEVITYKTRAGEAILEEISNTFTKNKSALQKSAVVDFNESPLAAVVIDRSERENVTDFFKGFLGIKRQYSTAELTGKLREVFLETVKEHRKDLPADFTSKANERFYSIVQSNDSFRDEETIRLLFDQFYSEEISRTFKKKLKKKDMLGENFRLDKGIKPPTKKKYRTQEGVSIQYDKSAEDTVSIKDVENGTIITIETSKLFSE